MEAARRANVPRFVQISTDEVYGSAPAGQSFTEQNSSGSPQSLFSQVKLRLIFWSMRMWRLLAATPLSSAAPTTTVPINFPEKLIPLMIGNAP